MPAMASAVPSMPVRNNRTCVARQTSFSRLSIVLLPMIAVAGTWGLPAVRTVHISVDSHVSTFESFQRTVGGVLAAHKIILHEGDRVVPPADTVLWPGIQVSILRAVPVHVTVGGSTKPARVAAYTVAGALQQLNVTVGPLDRIFPDASSAVASGMTIRIERREWRTGVERSAIPFPTQVVADGSVFKGSKLLRSSGRPGVKQRTVKVLYADGRPISVEPLAWTVAEAPVPRVTAIGTRTLVASRGDFVGREYLVVEATAYYPGPNNYGGGVGSRTAIGMVAQRGIIAVDPSVIPLGTKLFIDGYGYGVAGDTGGAIQGLRVDLCYNTYDEAMRYGRQRGIKVYLLGKAW
jgi:3D (Asp-Asp-Asp) domain-containing protein